MLIERTIPRMTAPVPVWAGNKVTVDNTNTPIQDQVTFSGRKPAASKMPGWLVALGVGLAAISGSAAKAEEPKSLLGLTRSEAKAVVDELFTEKPAPLVHLQPAKPLAQGIATTADAWLKVIDVLLAHAPSNITQESPSLKDVNKVRADLRELSASLKEHPPKGLDAEISAIDRLIFLRTIFTKMGWAHSEFYGWLQHADKASGGKVEDLSGEASSTTRMLRYALFYKKNLPFFEEAFKLTQRTAAAYRNELERVKHEKPFPLPEAFVALMNDPQTDAQLKVEMLAGAKAHKQGASILFKEESLRKKHKELADSSAAITQAQAEVEARPYEQGDLHNFVYGYDKVYSAALSALDTGTVLGLYHGFGNPDIQEALPRLAYLRNWLHANRKDEWQVSR